MLKTKKWFDTQDTLAAGNQHSSVLYKNIPVDTLLPFGVLESLDISKAMFVAAKGFPLKPKKETFSLISKDKRLEVRYFLNFNPVEKQNLATVRFLYEGKPVLLRITAEEYSRAKKVFLAGKI